MSSAAITVRLNSALTAPTNVPTDDGGDISCTSDSTLGTIYAARRGDRDWLPTEANDIMAGISASWFENQAATSLDFTITGEAQGAQQYVGFVQNPETVYSGTPWCNGSYIGGDGVRYATMGAITIPDGDDIRVSWSGIKHAPGDSVIRLFGRVGEDRQVCHILDDDNGAGPGTFSVRNNIDGTVIDMAGAFLALADYAHYEAVWTHISDVHSVSVNGGAPVQGSATQAGGFVFNIIGKAGNNYGYLDVGETLRDIEVTNITTGEKWYFPLDEGTGTAIKCYEGKGGIAKPANDGAWTPDASWESFNAQLSNVLIDDFTSTAIFSIVDVDGVIEANNPTVYHNQGSVEINCINAGAVEGLVEFGGVLQQASDVDWEATPSGASALTVGNIDATGLTIGQSYDLKVYKPV